MLEPRRLRLPGPSGDVAVASGVGLAALSDRPWTLPGLGTWQWTVAVVLTIAVLVVLRRPAPLLALVGVVALWLAVHTPDAAQDPFFQFVSLMIAVFALGAHAPLGRGLLGLAVAVGAFAAMNVSRGEDIGAPIAGFLQFSVGHLPACPSGDA